MKLKRGALFRLRNDPAVVEFLEAMGVMVRDKANNTLTEGGKAKPGTPSPGGYRMSSSPGINYPYGHHTVNVYTASNHAKRSNAVHDTLYRIVSAT